MVTGLGVVSAVGGKPTEFWTSLLAGTSAFKPITICDVTASEAKIGAEITDFSLGRYMRRSRKLERFWPRPARFALAAGLQALANAGCDMPTLKDRLGVYVGTSIGTLGETFAMHAELHAGACRPSFGFMTVHHSIAMLVSSALDCRGPLHTTTSGCNSTIDAIGQAARLIAHGDADLMLVIGTDSELVTDVFVALDTAKALATRYNQEPERASRPFDINRDGNVLGEGAAALLLETRASAEKRGARAYARMAGVASRANGRNREYRHDMPTMDINPVVRTLTAAIGDAGWNARDVDAFSANGSASKLYDPLEAQAIHAVFGESSAEQPPVHSIKSMLGQHGASTTAFQAVAAALSLSTGILPPTINCDNIDPLCGDLRIVREPTRVNLRRILLHAIGYGGFYYSALAMEAADDAVTVGTPPPARWSEETEVLRPILGEILDEGLGAL